MKGTEQYNLYVTEDGVTVYIPKAFTEQEQEESYQSFIAVLAEVLTKYGTDAIAKNDAEAEE